MRRHLWHRQKRHHLYKQICIISKAFTVYEGISKAVTFLSDCSAFQCHLIRYYTHSEKLSPLLFHFSSVVPSLCIGGHPSLPKTTDAHAKLLPLRRRPAAAQRAIGGGRGKEPPTVDCAPESRLGLILSLRLSLSAFPIHGLFIQFVG